MHLKEAKAIWWYDVSNKYIYMSPTTVSFKSLHNTHVYPTQLDT